MDEEDEKGTEEQEGEGEEEEKDEAEKPDEEDENRYEEHEGEDFYYPPPSLDVFGSEVIKFKDEDEEQEEEEEPEAEDEETEEEKEAEPTTKVSEIKRESEEKDDYDQILPKETESERRISEGDLEDVYIPSLLEVREKQPTKSEVIYDEEQRRRIEEEMQKIIQKEEGAEVAKERKPVLKKRISITEVDVSGLYPPPKAIVSEVSFIYEEEEERVRITKIIESDADIVQFIINAVQDGLKHDPENIFLKEDVDSIAKLRRFIGDVVMKFKKGEKIDMPKIVNETLVEMKQNLKNILVARLREKLGKYEAIAEEPEEKPGEKPGVKEKEPGKKAKAKKTKSFEKTKSEVLEPEIPELEPEKESIPEEQPKTDAEIQTYEEIDWARFLTDSEAKIEVDPEVKKEMDEYVARRKKELDEERKLIMEKKAKEKKYATTDPQMQFANENLTVTMKFVLNTGDTYTCAYRFFMVFKEIKEDLAGIFRVPADVLIIYRDDAEILDHQSAYDLQPEIEPFDCVTFRLLTLDNDRWPLKSWHLEIPVPDIITCTVETGQDHMGNPEYKDVVVEIENKKIKKPFIGGYKDAKTGIEYHHAFTQSAPHAPKLPAEKRNTRDTQTALVRKKLVDTVTDKSTQMCRPDYFINTEEDKILTAKPYTEYDAWCSQRDIEGKVHIIQRYLRAMILRRYVKKLSEEYRRRKAWEEEQDRKRLAERETRIKNDVVNMTYPKTKADFNMLYAMVERWRKAQVERISKLKTEAPKRAEFCSVLEKEIKLLEAIEVHRIAILKEQRKRRNLKFMEKVSKPITWTGYRGMTIKMDTLKTQRARELKELYLSLTRNDLNYQVHEWPMGNDTMKSKMEIDPTTQKDAGYYECQADNQYAIDRRGFRTDYVIYTY